jgi:hypothetical protein
MSDSMSYALPNPVRPVNGESLTGLVIRNAEAYRFRDPLHLLKRLRPPRVNLEAVCGADPDSELGQRLRRLLGLSEQEFRQHSPWSGTENTVSIMGHSIWRELACPSARAVCPLCLREALHHRAVWLLDVLPVCAVHGTWLHKLCTRCHRPLGWATPSIHRCSSRRCGFDIRDAETRLADATSLIGISALHSVLHADNPATVSSLAMMPGTLLKVAFLLGRQALGFERIRRTSGFIKRERSRLPEVMNTGWQSLDDWPNGFHHLLDRLRDRASGRSGQGGLRKAFGFMSGEFFRWGQDPWGAPIAQAFAEYVASRDDLAVTAHTLKRYGSAEALRNRQVTGTEAARALGISATSLRRLAERTDLYHMPPQRAGQPSLVRAETLERLQNQYKGFLFVEEARKLLGVGNKVFVQLEASGLLPRAPESERVVALKAFRRAQLEEFLAACRGDAASLTREQGRTRGLWTIAASVGPGRSVVDICLALLSDRLKAAALLRSVQGVHSILLDPSELERCLPAQRRTMSAVEVSRVFGVHYRNVALWVRLGILSTTDCADRGEVGRRFSQADVDAFRRTYVTGKDLSQAIGADKWNGAVTRHLHFLGVSSVSGRQLDRRNCAVFRQSDITPEVLEKVRKIRQPKRRGKNESRRQGFERVAHVAGLISHMWGAPLDRVNNRFLEKATGRVVQIVSGSRPDLTGRFIFGIHAVSLARLREAGQAFVALVPAEGKYFLLVPLQQLQMHGGTRVWESAPHISVRFDGAGRPVDLAEWAMPMGDDYVTEAHP